MMVPAPLLQSENSYIVAHLENLFIPTKERLGSVCQFYLDRLSLSETSSVFVNDIG